MPFDQTMLFTVANSDLSGFLRSQENPVVPIYTGIGAPTWSVTNATLAGAPSASSVDLENVFPMNAAGEVTMNLDALNDLNGGLTQAIYDEIVTAIVTGDQLVLTVSGVPAGETLLIDLRAIKNVKFVMGDASLSPTPATTDNLVLPDGVADYTITFTQGATTLTALTPGSGGAPGSAADTSWNDIALDAAASSPGSEVEHGMRMNIIRDGVTSELLCDIHVPTDLVMAFDRSGSMNGAVNASSATTKWEAAVQVGAMFSRLFTLLSPPSVAASNSIRLMQWWWSGSAPADLKFEPVAGFAAGNASPPPAFDLSVDPTAGGGTPIGEALVNCRTELLGGAGDPLASKWRKRAVIILSDGLHNSGTPNLSAGVLSDALFPHTGAADEDKKIALHAVQYLPAGAAGFNENLDLMRDVSGGVAYDSSSDSDPLASDNLFSMYADVITSIFPVDYSIGGGLSMTPVEDGVERVVFVASTTDIANAPALTVTSPDTLVDSGSSPGFAWEVYDLPSDGAWSASSTTGQVYAFYDLALRFQAGADPVKLGEPIKLWATLTYRGRPVSQADVRLAVRYPSESIGEVLTEFVRGGGLQKAAKRKQISNKFMQLLRAIAAGKPYEPRSLEDAPELRAELMKLLEAERLLPLQYQAGGTSFNEVAPGRYEVTLDPALSANEYSRNAYIRADGVLESGRSFARNRRISVTLLPEPSPDESTANVIAGAPSNGVVRWTVTVTPKAANKKHLGPGLAHFVGFRYADPKLREQHPPLVTRDGLDGTYTTILNLPEGQKLPELEFVSTTHRKGDKTGLIAFGPGGRINRGSVKLRIVLNKIELLDDHDPCLKGAGELVFKTAVAPNASPGRLVTTRLPERKHYKTKSGATIEVDRVIFEGLVEKKTKVDVSITGQELDWPALFDKNDRLARYFRVLEVPEKTTKYTPDDEPNDPESLADWKVWYTVEVS